MATHRAPKQWSLTKVENVNSFENWKENLRYVLTLDPNFAPFLVDNFRWEKKTRANPNRGFIDDVAPVPVERRRTAAQKVTQLELMLGQIANYCPVISRNTIIRNSTSVESIWQFIRSHYGFQSSGGHFLDLADIKLEHNERPEDLYQRLMAFVEDNLLKPNGNITHHGENIVEEEELTPTLENFIVLLWLKLTHPDLPKLIKQRYGTELRSRTLASIKPEISQALTALLDELHHSEEARVMRLSANKPLSREGTRRYSSERSRSQRSNDRQGRPQPTCPLCTQAGRRNTAHFLSSCSFLPESDKRFMTRSRLIAAIEGLDILDDDDAPERQFDQDESPDDPTHTRLTHSPVPQAQPTPVASSRRVQIERSPFLNVYYKHYPLKVVLDSGSETNMIRESVAQKLGITINKSSHQALQADGHSPLAIKGETRLEVSRGKHIFSIEALIVENLDVDILAGVPFMDANDVGIRPAKRQVILHDGSIINYAHSDTKNTHQQAAHILRATVKTTVLPGDFLEVPLPFSPDDSLVAIEPHVNSKLANQWPPVSITQSIEGKVRLLNNTDEPLSFKPNDQIGQAIETYVPQQSTAADVIPMSSAVRSSSATAEKLHSSTICVDPDNVLPADIRQGFATLHQQFDQVFDPKFPGYNGAVGPLKAVVNMGPVQPPQRKGRLPQYSRNKLVELQSEFDRLENLGVFQRPDEVPVVAEYLNPSFLVKKPSGGHRLVTAFSEVGSYSKPQPSLLPDVDSTLRQIARWKYLIKTDLTSAFYQIPLDQQSMKYCGVVTPFRGVRVYARSAMGMPGSETALEELLSVVLGDLIQEGILAKLADDLYCGGNTPYELLQNWSRVLAALDKCNLRLSPAKTIIAPKTTSILGWIWSNGTIRASNHRISALSSCDPPDTVKNLRSFIGAVKILSRVIPHCSTHLAPLEAITAGAKSTDTIKWSDDMLTSFNSVKALLHTNQTIHLPQPSDQLWIVTDGAVKVHGLGATMYITRADNKPLLAGFFSAKLKKRQMDWLPCELEALCIAASIRHYSPYIVQSTSPACILTDSKPCVEAYQKLTRGEFSASSRLTTFLTAASRYQLSVRHLQGSANTPSDFTCRNAPPCDEPNCQVCRFIYEMQESVVRSISVQDVVSGSVRLPFTTRSTWRATQNEDPDLRRVHSHLKQGTRPSKKATNIRDIKRYLQVATIAHDGLLVVKHSEPFAPCQERIIVPRQAVPGLLTALHIKLSHPSTYQLKQVLRRSFYFLDCDRYVEDTTSSCHTCVSLKSFPTAATEQSTSLPPDAVATRFAADVIRRNRQFILVLREHVTSYTTAMLIENEQHTTLRDALLTLCLNLHAVEGPPAVIRVDPAPGFQALVDDTVLRGYGISIDIGDRKNINKNPIAERAVQEVEAELLKLDPNGNPVSTVSLTIAVSHLNSRLRSSGLSSREMWSQRDQFSHKQILLSDDKLITQQYDRKLLNHPSSEKAKALNRPRRNTPDLVPGHLVHLYTDLNKTKGRERYLVVSVDYPYCVLRKFTDRQFRGPTYRVKLEQCFLVPGEFDPHVTSCRQRYPFSQADDAEEEDDCLTLPAEPVKTIEPVAAVTSPPMMTTSPPMTTQPPEAPAAAPTPLTPIPDEISTPEPPTSDNRTQPSSLDADTTPRSTRPKRVTRPPEYLKEYVLDM